MSCHVVAGHKPLEHVNLGVVNPDSKELTQHLLDGSEAHPIGDMLIDDPALQPVKVAVQPLVLFWNKVVPAVQAPMNRRAVLEDSSRDPAGLEDEIKSGLYSRDEALCRLSPDVP